jgi:2-phospho-L-lactate guanylyltransferase
VTLAVVVPVRAFDLGKSRLAEMFTPDERQALARAMAEVVVAPASGSDWLVVCDDERIAAWARDRNARPIQVSAHGLNASLDAARGDVLASSPADWIAVAHADLPLAHGLGETVAATLAGSNVVVIPRHLWSNWEFRYGPGSFAAHCTMATELGATVTVIDDPHLATDVDTVDDLDLVRDFISSTLPHWNK